MISLFKKNVIAFLAETWTFTFLSPDFKNDFMRNYGSLKQDHPDNEQTKCILSEVCLLS